LQALGASHSVLFVAFHFPPQAGSSGILRTLKFVKYLPEYGWHASVLTVNSRAFARIDRGLLAQVPPGVPVMRPFCLDISRHLSIKGRYPKSFAIPDRWSTWIASAIPAGLKAIREQHSKVIVSTYPIPSAIVIGLILKRITRLPWVVDFRDSMTEPDYPRDDRMRRIYQFIEQRAVAAAERILFTAPSARMMYLNRYSKLRQEQCIVIQNGYDEDDFAGLDNHQQLPPKKHYVRLLHLGLLYPEERNPQPFFRALYKLKKEGAISSSSLVVDLRASGAEKQYSELLHRYELLDLVRLLPPLPYREGLEDASRSDAFLLFQDGSCNHQIPAKLYEYLRLQKPIFALTAHEGNTAAILTASQGATVVSPRDFEEIARIFPKFLASLRSQSHTISPPSFFAQFDRRTLTGELARCLNNLVAGKSSLQK